MPGFHLLRPLAVLRSIRQWFSNERDTRLARKLEALEAEARMGGEGTRGQIYNRAGDLCANAELPRNALVYYGRAVDAYLNAGFLGPAAALCRKILRFAPDTVRAHCTLACLAVQDRQFGDAREAIDAFVKASERTGTEQLAVARLRLMAAAVEDQEIKRYLGECLQRLGDALGGQRVLSALRKGEPAREQPVRLVDGEGQWERLLRAAVLDPDELWRHA